MREKYFRSWTFDQLINTCLQNHTCALSCAHAFITHIHVLYSGSIYIFTHSSAVVDFTSAGSIKAAPPFSPSHLPSLLSLYLSHSVALSFALAPYAMLYFCCLCCLGTLFYSVFCSVLMLWREKPPPADFLFSFLSCDLGLSLFLSLSLSDPNTEPLSLSLSLSVRISYASPSGWGEQGLDSSLFLSSSPSTFSGSPSSCFLTEG